MAVAVFPREIGDAEPGVKQGATLVEILAAGDFGDDLSIGMDEIEHCLDVLTDGVEEFGPVQGVGADGEGLVADAVVADGASLGVLAVGIDVDGFGEPLVDAAEVAGIGVEFVEEGEGGAGDPTMVRGVHAAPDKSFAGLFDGGKDQGFERGEAVLAGVEQGAAHALDDEGCVGRRVVVGDGQVPIAVGGLDAGEAFGGELEAIEDEGGMEVAGLGMEVGGGEGIEDTRGGAAVEEAVGTGDVPAVAVGGAQLLALDEIVDGFVVCVEFGLRESRRGGGGQGGGGCREGGSL
ncbi:MAG: hypothetical protein NTV52_16925 [Acidobacteria bacterium]|nr:hypothetical protein [Acidobacteriota bacterium]